MAKTTLIQANRRKWIDQGPSETKKSENKVRKTFYIDHTVYQKLRKRAFDLETSMSKILNNILDKNIETGV